jgi:hypothetical protein
VTTPLRLGATLAAVVAVAGCHRGRAHCAPGSKASLEVRDGSGALTLAQKGDDLCDGRGQLLGTVVARKDGLTIRDPSGANRLELQRESANAAVARDREGPRLRLYRDGRELRVLAGDGIPLGSVVPQGSAATLFNPASQPLGRVAMRDRDAVVMDLQGTALTYVVPASGPGVAGVFGIPRLQPVEQAAIYIFWSR